MAVQNREDNLRDLGLDPWKVPTGDEPAPQRPAPPVWNRWVIGLILAVLSVLLLAGIALAEVAPNVAPGTTVSTTGPVTSSTQIDVGSFASSAFAWAATVALGVVVPFIVNVLLAVAARFGQATTDALRARFTEFVTNGANLLVAVGAERLKGLTPIEVKGAILADLVRYVQQHGAETVAKLGVDPQSPKLVEAVKAQLETAIANPAVPTAAMLSPPPTNPKVTAL